MKNGKDRNGNEYVEFDWIRVTRLLGNKRYRINAISSNGKVKQGPEIKEEHISLLFKGLCDLK